MDLFINFGSERSKIVFIDVKERLVDVFILLLIVLNHKRRVIQKVIQVCIGQREIFVCNIESFTFEKVSIDLLFELLVVL